MMKDRKCISVKCSSKHHYSNDGVCACALLQPSHFSQSAAVKNLTVEEKQKHKGMNESFCSLKSTFDHLSKETQLSI